MEDLLYCKDAYEPIMGKKPEGTTDANWITANRIIIALIRQWIDDSVFRYVPMEINVHELWKKLESLYERKMTQNKVFVI
jgi:gag-polypeptide of LTR copia-type